MRVSIEEQIEGIKSAAVFVGASGFGPWQNREMRAFLSEFVNRDCPVIPVLLENAPEKPQLPPFLKAMTWVNFQQANSQPMERLIWGITGERPKEILPTPNRKIVKPQTAKNFTEDLGNGVKLEMVYIPAGEFMMGTDDEEIERLCKKYNLEEFRWEKPRHKVTFKQGFYLGKYPITQAQYEAIMGNNPSHFQNKGGWGEHPVECVSWNSAQEFCQKLSDKTGRTYKLPSEAQWEYACRAGSTTQYYFGDNDNQLSEDAWYADNSGDSPLDSVKLWQTDSDNYEDKLTANNCRTHPVGQKKANKWGLYDMHGNVWEWCEDDWQDNYQNLPNDGKSWLDQNTNIKVLRGGSWDGDPNACRSASRNYDNARDIFSRNGFRVVCS